LNQPDTDAHVPLKQVSQLSGLSPVLIRAWERRYAFPAVPRRTAGGHRRYTPSEAEMLRHAAILVRTGLRAADAIARVRAAQPLPATAGALSSAELVELLRQPDASRALEYLRWAGVAIGFQSTLEEIVVPALRAVGQAWAERRLSVADEHVATGAVMSWLGAVRAELPPMEAGPPVCLIANPEGEEHEIGVWALDVLLRMRGLPVRALGASVPLPDLLVEAARPSLTGVVLAISRKELRRQVSRLAEALAADHRAVRIYAGGAGAIAPLPAGVIRLPGTLTETADRLVADLSGGPLS
jgi:DNA-binding transcriptional MerR regulator/methylmalonyl-CoA mutase cobalamin-binding subunit